MVNHLPRDINSALHMTNSCSVGMVEQSWEGGGGYRENSLETKPNQISLHYGISGMENGNGTRCLNCLLARARQLPRYIMRVEARLPHLTFGNSIHTLLFAPASTLIKERCICQSWQRSRYHTRCP